MVTTILWFYAWLIYVIGFAIAHFNSGWALLFLIPYVGLTWMMERLIERELRWRRER